MKYAEPGFSNKVLDLMEGKRVLVNTKNYRNTLTDFELHVDSLQQRGNAANKKQTIWSRYASLFGQHYVDSYQLQNTDERTHVRNEINGVGI